MISNCNQGIYNTDKLFDEVTGYSISEVENVLHNCSTIIDLKVNLKNSYKKPNEEKVDNLFTQYKNLKR